MTVFLCNALGFLVQLFPCALMLFLPFPSETYRFRRERIFTRLVLASAVMAVLFSAVVCLRDTDRYSRHIILSNSFMLAAILLVLAAYIWLVRESLMKKTLVFFIVLFYAVMEYIIVNEIHALIYPGPDTTMYPYTRRFLMLYALTTALSMPLMLMFVVRPLREYIQKIEPQSMRVEFFIAVFSTMMYFVMTIYCDTVIGKLGLLQFFLPQMLFLTLNQILIYWMLFRESVRRRQDSERRQAMEIQQLQYERIVGDMENTRRMRHDLRFHYNSLNDMLEQGKLDEMRDYLSKLSDAAARRMNETYCRNMTVNGLLQYYVGLARDEQIRCEVRAECGEIQIEPVDLTVLFGNIIENAINACRKCTGDRWINVQIGTVHGSLAIEISNSCSEVRLSRHSQTKDGFFSAEDFLSDRAGGGYGLRSIASTAQKYGGSARFRFNSEKKTFTSQVRLNMHTDV